MRAENVTTEKQKGEAIGFPFCHAFAAGAL
jgi:hypothetical protein